MSTSPYQCSFFILWMWNKTFLKMFKVQKARRLISAQLFHSSTTTVIIMQRLSQKYCSICLPPVSMHNDRRLHRSRMVAAMTAWSRLVQSSGGFRIFEWGRGRAPKTRMSRRRGSGVWAGVSTVPLPNGEESGEEAVPPS